MVAATSGNSRFEVRPGEIAFQPLRGAGPRAIHLPARNPGRDRVAGVPCEGIAKEVARPICSAAIHDSQDDSVASPLMPLRQAAGLFSCAKAFAPQTNRTESLLTSAERVGRPESRVSGEGVRRAMRRLGVAAVGKPPESWLSRTPFRHEGCMP